MLKKVMLSPIVGIGAAGILIQKGSELSLES